METLSLCRAASIMYHLCRWFMHYCHAAMEISSETALSSGSPVPGWHFCRHVPACHREQDEPWPDPHVNLPYQSLLALITLTPGYIKGYVWMLRLLSLLQPWHTQSFSVSPVPATAEPCVGDTIGQSWRRSSTSLCSAINYISCVKNSKFKKKYHIDYILLTI